MPWKATDALKERTKFVLEWERRWQEAEGGPVNMSELCRMFGVSRPTGYTWVERYRDGNHDLLAVAERSRRPKTSPTAISPELEDRIVDARKMHPRWGPKKLHAMLVDRNPGVYVPSASAIAKILKRRGLTKTRRRRRSSLAMAVSAPFRGCESPNDVWCIDFKGWFRTQDQIKCYPLTLIDAFSRFLLRCEALVEPDGRQVQRILDSAFLEFGRPTAIRSDGGPPFASTGPAMLTTTMVWLLKLGITIEGVEGKDYPFECSIDDGQQFKGRCWDQTTYMWKASAMCHKPLYFEEEQLERYGHSFSPCFQPFVSGAHFFVTLPVLPYCMGVEPPCECIYALGYYRPGSCAPYMCNPVPLSLRGALFEAGAVTGAAAALP